MGTPIDCIKKYAKHLAKDVDESISREAATDLALKEFEKLHNELENFKKQLNQKYQKQPFVAPDKSEEINAINEKYKSLIEEANKPTQPIPAEEKQPTIEVIDEDSGATEEGEKIRLSHADTEKIYQEAGLPERLTTPTKKREQLEKEAEAILQKGYDFDKVAKETMQGDYNFEDTDQILFARRVADLKAKQKGMDVNSEEFTKLQDEIEKLSRASDVAGTIGGRFLQSRKNYVPVEETISDELIIEKEANAGVPLTEKQKETVQKEFEEIQKAKDAFNAYMAEKEAEFSKKEADAAIQKAKAKKSERKDYAAERTQIFESIKDKLKKARQDTNVTILPYAKELIAIAPDVAKLVKNLAEDASMKLADIVDNIHQNLKEYIPQITKNDVNDLIAGVYNEKKPTRNELAERVVNLRREAQLINKLDKLLKGEVPVYEKKKRQETKEIEKLKQQIAEIKSLDKDAIAQRDALLELAASRQKEIGKKLDKAEKDAEPKQKKTEEQKLSDYKKRVEKDIKEVQEKITQGDYSLPEPPKKVVLDKEAQKLRGKLIQLNQQRELRRLLLQRQNEGKREKALRYVAEVANVPRTLMTIADFSGLLRQNIFFTASHPLMTSKAMPGMFKSFTSQKVYDRWFADLKDSPRYGIIQDNKLAIADSLNHDLSKREEDFMSTIAEKLPIVGNAKMNLFGKRVPIGLGVVKGSERSYTMLLNKMRVDMFNYFVDKLEARGITYENSPKVYKATAEYINNATGRSDFGKTLNRVAPVLNSIFFSPRLIASRVNMLTYFMQPRFWKTLPKEVRIDYMRGWISLLGVGLSILALAKAGGAEVEDDPRSSDFGKIKDGNTRWDIWGGAQPYVRVLSQVISGQRKSTRSGEIYSLDGEDIFGQNKAEVVAGFFRNKLAPVPGAAIDLLSRRTSMGDKIVYQWGGEGEKEVSISEYARQRLLPMTITGTQEAMKDAGIKAMFTVGIPNIFGVGTSTYDTKPTGRTRPTPNRERKERERPEK